MTWQETDRACTCNPKGIILFGWLICFSFSRSDIDSVIQRLHSISGVVGAQIPARVHRQCTWVQQPAQRMPYLRAVLPARLCPRHGLDTNSQRSDVQGFI